MERVRTKGYDAEILRKYNREYMKERRARYKANGLCTQCGSKAIKGKTLCAECNDLQKYRTNKYYAIRNNTLNGSVIRNAGGNTQS